MGTTPAATLPEHAATVVIGAGTSGAALAGRLIEMGASDVLVLEAGPDYGASGSGAWPEELLDARAMPSTHDWGYGSADTYADRTVPFERAKVIGGCSSHNSCVAIWGSRADYDRWEELAGPRWGLQSALQVMPSVEEHLRVRRYAPEQVGPFHAACLEAMASAGVPLVDDLNNLDEDEGAATFAVNIADGVRWNAAFGYLDPVRDDPGLRVCGDVLVDKLLWEGNRVTGVACFVNGKPHTLTADTVVLAAGVYGTPAILMRSGVGDPDDLDRLGISSVVALPGVGGNLHDHPAVWLRYTGTPELIEMMRAAQREQWTPEEQSLTKLRSAHCEEAYDLHVYPMGGPDEDGSGRWHWYFPVACMTPKSRGSVRLRDADPFSELRIDHGYLSDVDGHDRRVLVDGVRRVREIVAQPALASLIGTEVAPGPERRSADEVAEFVDQEVVHYYHPVGTCRMGEASDPYSVTDAQGKVHGTKGLYVADCSILPEIPRANTNLPAALIGEQIARVLAQNSNGGRRDSLAADLTASNHQVPALDHAAGGAVEGADDRPLRTASLGQSAAEEAR